MAYVTHLKPDGTYQPLKAHEENVAALAGKFAEAFVEEHILCHKGAYTGKSGITRDRTGKLWYYRNSKR